jgi:nucleotide-binding universal stress UspA family protein
MTTSNKILVALDFSENPEDVLARVLALQPDDNVEILLLHVVSEIPHTSYFIESSHPWVDVHKISVETAESSMERYMTELKKALPEAVITPIIREGIAWDRIVQIANAHNVDYIIVGEHCHGGIAHLFHTNVAEHVMRNAKRNVLSFYVPS